MAPERRYPALMNRSGVFVVTAGVLAAVLLAAVVTAGEVTFAQNAPTIPWDLTAAEPVQITIPPAGVGNLDAADTTIGEIPGFLSLIFKIVLTLGAIALIIGIVRYAWRHRPRVSWRRRVTPDPFTVRDDIVAAVAADAEAQRAALLGGVPRNAIVECWLRLEALVADAGLDRQPADTSTEFTMRILSRYAVDAAAIAGLADLYREARFSTHEMDESDRTAAIVALDALHESLRSHEMTAPDISPSAPTSPVSTAGTVETPSRTSPS